MNLEIRYDTIRYDEYLYVRKYGYAYTNAYEFIATFTTITMISISDEILIKILELTRWRNTIYQLPTVCNTLRSGVRFHTTVELLAGILKGQTTAIWIRFQRFCPQKTISK